jgi:cholestenol delta-isomerase
MTSHPYYPIGVSIKDYQASERSLLHIVGLFSLALGSVLGAVLAMAVYVRPSMSRADRLGILWFALCN